MALDKAGLKSAILTAMQASANKDAATTQDDFANDLANAIDIFVKGGDVDGTAGGDALVDGKMT